MLMRTDPFRDFDRLAQQVLGTAARPAVMPMDAWREGDQFIVEFDLPGVDEDSLNLDVERNVLTVHATRPDLDPEPGDGVRRATAWGVQPAAVLGRDPRQRPDPGQLWRRSAAVDHPGRRESQTAPNQDRQRPRRRRSTPNDGPPSRLGRGAAFGEGGEVTWRPTPNGQPACSTRWRRSWRPNGYACSRTKPCGSSMRLTCSPRCLRPDPVRTAPASPPPSVGGQANRCQTTVAGGRRGDGPQCRYGLPSGLLRQARLSC